jgi:methylthioribose-1-phosphate isomerase
MLMKAKPGIKTVDSGVMPLRIEKDRVFILDQRKLPEKEEYYDATELNAMCFAIKEMVIRGAPSIGVAAAFGLACEARRIASSACDGRQFLTSLKAAKDKLQQTRPTAVNLSWATEKLYLQAQNQLEQKPQVDCRQLADSLFKSAADLLEAHVKINQAIGEFGSSLVAPNSSIMTHCNTGPLAAGGWGTALGVIRSAFLKGVCPSVIVGETRPRNQGARLTMWELHKDGIPCTLITDSMAGHMMVTGKVDMVIVGADRIATNGDTANKIGTYNLAVLAKHHDIPFYVAAPLSTFDPSILNGTIIPIEERDLREVTEICHCGGMHTVSGAKAFNPAFDVTPAELITGIITEAGILLPPYNQSIHEAFTRKNRQCAVSDM